LLGLSIVILSNPSRAQVQPNFFGMHVNKLSSMPLPVPVGSFRLWDTATNWAQLCPSSDYSSCNWRHLDEWLAAVKGNGVSEVVYTFGKTPEWVSSNPHGECGRARPGVCYPPRDVAKDGGGTDQAFRSFVRALVEHNQQLDPSTYARIKCWGIWNEPTANLFWHGSTEQLLRMAKDASEIIKRADPQALMLTPEPAANARRNATEMAIDFLHDYLKRGGDKYADVIAFHVYANAVEEHPLAEDVFRIVQRVKGELAHHPEVAGKPLWITEGSWGRSDEANWTVDDQPSAFLIRYCVLSASQGIQRLYWYGWDVPTGTLSVNGQPLPAGYAFKEVQKWIVGRSVTNCQAKSHLWSCNVSGDRYRGRIVWNDEYQRTSSYDATGFTTYRQANGQAVKIEAKARVLTVGNSPLLLEENDSRSSPH
jgi:hypothetical protein